MKTIFLSILLTASVLYVSAQSKAEQQVASTVEKFRTAMVDGDGAVLNELTDASLTYAHSSGKLENRNEFVDAIASGKSDFKSINLSDQTINVVNNTAIVRHRLTGDVVDNGNAMSVNLTVLLVWVKQSGKWKLVARQAIKNAS